MQQAVLKKHNFRTYYYGNFASESGMARESSRVDPANPGDTIWRTFDHRPRFGNNYVGLRNRLAILSEAYSYLDFRGRVRVTEVFVEESLRAIAANGRKLTALTAQIDGETKTLRRSDRATSAARPRRRASAWSSRSLRCRRRWTSSSVMSTKQLNERSGREMLVMSDKVIPVRMKDFGIFQPTRMVAMPAGWLIPKPHVESGRYAAAIDRLRWHGLRIQTGQPTAPRSTSSASSSSRRRKSERLFQGHQEARLAGRHENAKLSIQPGRSSFRPISRSRAWRSTCSKPRATMAWSRGITRGWPDGRRHVPVYRVMNARALKLE